MLRIAHDAQFTGPMDALRQTCYPGAYPSGTSKDPFDDRALHVTVHIGRALAAYVRLVPGPDGYFEWTRRGQADIPTGREVLDLTQGAVAPAFRGRSLFELVLIEGLLYAHDHGFTHAVGGAKVGRGFLPMLLELGFQKSGPPVRAHFANGKTYLGQCFAADVQGRAADWHRRKHALLRRLAAAEERATRSVDSIKEG
jgi:GNAT superfamily N-acetyltransferase